MNGAGFAERAGTSQTPYSSELASAMARRSAAFDAGEDAFWRGAIGADAYMLYRLLVRLCRDQSWCWPGLDWLAEHTRVSVGTIKRRLDELERAFLIARRQRPGGMTARTTVLALAHPHGASEPAASAALPSDDQAAEPEAFFCAADTTIIAPADGSAVIPHTMDSLPTNGGVGGESDATRLLRENGVLSPRVRAEFEHHPVAEIRRCLAVAHNQPNVRDPAALAVALLRGHAAVQREARDAHAQQQRGNRALAASNRGIQALQSMQTRRPAHAPPGTTAEHTPGSDHAPIWLSVARLLADTFGPELMTTWFADARIAVLNELEAVVIVGNVLARTWIRAHAAAALEAAFCSALGRCVDVAVELG